MDGGLFSLEDIAGATITGAGTGGEGRSKGDTQPAQGLPRRAAEST